MTEEANAPAAAAPEAPREIPSDITEYKKFVDDGGLAHNAQLANREAAIAAAKAAGILPEPEKKPSRMDRRLANFQKKMNGQIHNLEARIPAPEPAAAAAQNGTNRAPAETKPAATPAAKTPEANTPPRPQDKDFSSYEAFVEALTEWTADRRLDARERKAAEDAASRTAAASTQAMLDGHNKRLDEAIAHNPDWHAAFEGLNDDSFTDPMAVFMIESERGPDITYYLATHRDELERIAKLSNIRQVAALGKIEAQLEDEPAEDAGVEQPAAAVKGAAKADEDEEEAPPRRHNPRVSKAPPPMKPLGGSSAPPDQMPDPKDFKAYEIWSRRQAAKGVKR